MPKRGSGDVLKCSLWPEGVLDADIEEAANQARRAVDRLRRLAQQAKAPDEPTGPE